MHRNNYTREELRSPRSVEEADRLLAQALRRTARFEARTHLAVSKVMVSPHESVGLPVLAELPKFGFEAVAAASARACQSQPAALCRGAH
jgi:hypothetical protein